MDPKPDPNHSLIPDKDVKAPNLLERAKEEIEAILHTERPPHHHKETHGLRSDIDENTPLTDVKAPNVFERAKEEIEALVQTIHPKKESKSHDLPDTRKRDEILEGDLKQEKPDSLSEEDIEALNIVEGVKVEGEAMKIKRSPHRHHKETHGMSDDIDENTPIDEVKAPNVFERAKEEVEALVQAIHPKKKPDDLATSPKKEGGLGHTIGRGLEKVCSPWEKGVKQPKSKEAASKEDTEAMHHKETHGHSDDIDDNTSVNEVKGPNVFERAKEELEALVETIHSKKEPHDIDSSAKKEHGFRHTIARGFEKVCSPRGHK